MDERLIKPALVRLVWLLIAEMPLAKNTARVAGLLEHLRQRGGLERHAFALEDGVGHAVFHGVTTGQQRRAGRRARRAHHEAREPRTRIVQLVEMRRPNPRMPMPPNRPVSLVIRNDEDDVRFLGVGFK